MATKANHTNAAHFVGPRATAQSTYLWAMSAHERRQAMYAGQLTLTRCCEWAARRPDECPKLDGEFWFIAITTPEIAD